MPIKVDPIQFSRRIGKWFKRYGRKDLPWQQELTPYRVWVSEIMLQQTQVKTVIPYYIKFINSYPDIKALSNSSVDDVLAQWTGLGYYARARNLHKTAQIIQLDYQGIFPTTVEELNALPGIGLSTAGAILSLAMKKHAAILDGNCKRIYARCFKISGYPAGAKVEQQLWQLANNLTPKKHSSQFNQAMMDIGSIICNRTKPYCLQSAQLCPLSELCLAFQTNSVLDYPEKKPTKKQVEKSALFVIVLSQDTQKQELVLLEKRPPTGIWGGLWCFPEFADEERSIQWLETNHPNYSVIRKIKPQQHIFSHFRLNYTVLVVKAKLSDNIADSDKNQLFSIEESLQLGLATPIKHLLKSLN